MTLILLAALGCKNTPEDSSVDDTTVQDSAVDDTGAELCQAKPSVFVPEDESEDVYYRDALSVAFTMAAPSATFELSLDDSSEPISVNPDWNDTSDLASLTLELPLQPESEYSLTVSVCGADYVNTFTTSAYGKPLLIGPEELESKTYLLALDTVKFVKPDNVATLIKTFLDMPILVNVDQVAGQELTLVGAEGWIDSQGRINQRKLRSGEDVPTWDFSNVDFSEAPYFSADSPGINIVYSGQDIPIYDFHLEGTFDQEAGSFGGGKLWGLADTRNTAPLLSETDPYHVCNLIENFGTSCEACPDGEVFCLYIEGHDIVAQEVEVQNGFERIEPAE